MDQSNEVCESSSVENEMSIFVKYKNSHHVHIGMKCLKSNEV